MQNHVQELKSTYDRIAEDWFRDHNDDDWWQPGTDRFVAHLKTASTVLDVGCGAGQKTKYLLSKGLHVIATDISEGQLAIAKREVPSAEYHVLDAYHQADLKQLVDGLYLQAILLHIPKSQVAEVLKSMLSVLKNGGIMYIAVKEQRPNGPEEEMKTESDYGYPYERFFSYFTMEELRDLMKNLSLTMIFENTVSQPDANWLQIIAQKG